MIVIDFGFAEFLLCRNETESLLVFRSWFGSGFVLVGGWPVAWLGPGGPRAWLGLAWPRSASAFHFTGWLMMWSCGLAMNSWRWKMVFEFMIIIKS
jgi:hypothetical protein